MGGGESFCHDLLAVMQNPVRAGPGLPLLVCPWAACLLRSGAFLGGEGGVVTEEGVEEFVVNFSPLYFACKTVQFAG